jgi:hypothetical protein
MIPAVWSGVRKRSVFPGIAVAAGMFLSALPSVVGAQEAAVCHVEAVDFRDWQAQQIVWVKLMFAIRVPKGSPVRGAFSVFASVHLQAELSDAHGDELKIAPLASVSDDAAEVSLPLINASGKDHGVLAATKIVSEGKNP